MPFGIASKLGNYDFRTIRQSLYSRAKNPPNDLRQRSSVAGDNPSGVPLNGGERHSGFFKDTPMKNIYKLTAKSAMGSTVLEVAKECYRISEQIGIAVEFIHNDRTYSVSLQVKQTSGPPDREMAE